MIRNISLALAACSTLATPGLAGDNVCEFTSETIENTRGYVSKIKDYSKKTAVYAEEKRICSVKFTAKLGENWVETHGFYVFGPEISENLACKKAVEKGKVKAVEQEYGSEIEYIAQQKCISLECGLQNGTLAVFVSTNLFDNIVYLVPTAAYALIMFVTSIFFVLLIKKTV